MAEEFDTDQLVEFCQRLGLADDGYLDEKQLAIVCNCIGLQAPEETLKELFEELDTDKDGRVCLNELSQMLRGMQKNPGSPEKLKKSHDSSGASQNSMSSTSSSNSIRGNEFSNITNGDKSTFSILDPHNSGFTKVGTIVDMWAQLGINQDDGIRILKDLGFPANSRNNSINVQDLTKALEEEMDNSKDLLSPVVQTALLTYRTETQYLRSICESIEGERDKLKSDMIEAHQRSSMLAQEVDEQTSRLEKNSQIMLQKMESKFADQIHELQQKFAQEKDSLQQALFLAESELKSLQENDGKLKSHIAKLNNENGALERELQTLNREIRTLNKTKISLEKEISRYVELENNLMEMERRSAEAASNNEGRLQQAHEEIQNLRDQNDELTSQLEGTKETVKILKAVQEKKRKKRKGSKLPDCERMEECFESPLEKMGKFHQSSDIDMCCDDPEELDSSIDPLLASCSQPDSGNFPAIAINLAACMGETSTDPFCSGGPPEYKTLEIEMDTVKEKIQSIISEKEHLIAENKCLKTQLQLGESSSKSSQPQLLQDCKIQITSKSESLQTQTQTDSDSSEESSLIAELRQRILQLENDSKESEKEKKELKDQCADLESSLDLLREEYEKCEDYWQDKLQEAREIYDQDRAATDEKFQDLCMKIKEYEENFMGQGQEEQNYQRRLPPIEERASLEQQVTDLEEECEELKKELYSVKIEQDSMMTNYQRQLESRAVEECGRLEQQVSALSTKCKEYENRLSSLVEEERTTIEETGMMEMLKDRIRQLEFQVRNQEEKFSFQVNQLQTQNKEKDDQILHLSRKLTPETPKTSSPSPSSPQPYNMWNGNQNQNDLQGKSKSLLEMLHQNQSKLESKIVAADTMLIWPQRYANPHYDKSNSMPFIPVGEQPYPFNNGWTTMQNPPQQHYNDPWTNSGKKAWCHVELGWLQALRAKLKQRDEQCFALQRAMQHKEMETDKIVTEMRYKHETEVANWESLMHASQELVRQQAIKHKDQAEKLAHSDLLMKDLWIENAKLMAALNATEQRVIHLENLLKYQMKSHNSQQNNSHHHQQNHNQQQGSSSSPRSLQYPPHNNNFS